MGKRFVKEEHYVQKGGGCGTILLVLAILFVILMVV